MSNTRLPILVFSLLISSLLTASNCAHAESPAPMPAALSSAPANTWVKVLELKTGERDQPVFVFASKFGKFVAAAGNQADCAIRPRHYDTEEFDLAQSKWINAYPPGMEQGRPESGPVSDEYTKQRSAQGGHGAEPFYKDGKYLRPGVGSQWNIAKTYGEYCYAADGSKGGSIYAYLWNKTLQYDVAARTWSDLNTPPRTQCRIWGSLCYDPLNKEVVHVGGDGGTADTSTWVYSIDKNEWRKLEFGSPKFKELFAKAHDLCWQTKTLVGRCAGRHAIAETAAESKVDLSAEAVKLTSSIEKFASDIKATELAGSEKAAAQVAITRLNLAASALKTAGAGLSSAITPEKIGATRAVRETIEQVVDALAPEPPGRARSQAVLNPVSNKIVVFGGDGLDRVLSDTWVYDCKTRVWEQRFPAKVPSPRAGHILSWLPGAKQVVLAGGYNRLTLPQEVWVYNVDSNEWKAVLNCLVPDNGPKITNRGIQVGAVSDGDILLCPNGTTVWGVKVDAAKPGAASEGAVAVAPGSYVINPIDPATWENAAHSDPAAARKTLNDLPANQWTALKFPKYAPGSNNRWGTTAYDTDRHQFLFWGGGHSASHEDDVDHFSVLGGFWTIGYTPDDPIENVYADQPTPLSFRDRCHVPVHAYRAYAYDQTAGRMFYLDRGYDPLVRDWVTAPTTGLEHLGPMHTHIKPTPAGAVALSTKGFFRFNAKTITWAKLPWNGPPPGDAWCDGVCMIYDSKRNCEWITFDKEILKYDFASGNVEKQTPAKPASLGQWLLPAEAVYLPDADLILAMTMIKLKDGQLHNYAFDPNDGKFYTVDLQYSDDGKPVAFKDSPFSWSDAMDYDPELKLVFLNNSSSYKVWALKFDRKSAKLTELKE